MAKQRVFLIEFNELSPVLLDEFMRSGSLPNFRRLWRDSVVYVSDAGETGGALQPWVQWPSVHSSLPYEEHGAYRLGDGATVKRDQLAAVLSNAGYRVGVFGSMNTNYGSADAHLNGYFLPDPWDKRGKAVPDWLQPYYDITSEQVKESTRHEPLTAKQAVALAAFMAKHGISAGTARAVTNQLLEERKNPRIKWRRASLFDRLQYDVFRKLNAQYDVQFASFFSNSTAHYQHFYWRHMQPERFGAQPADEGDASLREAIRYGYRAMDGLIERFLSDYPDAILVFATALSQEAYTGPKALMYKPNDFGALLKAANVSERVEPKPVMAEQFHLECGDEQTAQSVLERLMELQFASDGKPLLQTHLNGSAVFGGCKHYEEEPREDDFVVRKSDGARFPFRDLFYLVDGHRSGVHNPDGALWFRVGRHQIVDRKVSILDIAPTILTLLGVPVPAHMRGAPLPEVTGAAREKEAVA